jgi:hypothetical protein
MGSKDYLMKIEITGCEENGTDYHVHLLFTHDDGSQSKSIHIFPQDTLEWRAAEYGIDPTDTNTLLDIVLAEPYLTPEDWTTGSQLHDAETIEQARTHHLARCAQVKLRHRISTRGRNAAPTQLVREQHAMHPEALELKRQMVADGREYIRALRQPTSREGIDRDRVERLRAAMRQGRRP